MIELLSPAGSMASLKAALHFGADAVYGGMKHYGLRAFAGNFDDRELQAAVALSHAAGKKFYLTMNIFPFDDQLPGFLEAARLAREIGVDAVIAGDLGAIVQLREALPDLPVHVSTQASSVNAPTVLHYAALGCERVILAREMSLERIRALAQAVGDRIQLETFVHGASCVSWSGRCLLSAVMTGRSGNQGACAQPCRWQYHVVEEKRPGEYWPVTEDENGTYIFSAKDLNLMPLLPQLAASGISSLKIEGRMKTEYYVATVTGTYRRALDQLDAGFSEKLPGWMAELECASHRDSDTGFLLGNPGQPAGAEGFHQSREYIALCTRGAKAGEEATFQLKNRFHAGDTLELLTPRGSFPFTAGSLLREKTGERLDTLGIGGESIRLAVPYPTEEGDILRGPNRNHRT